MRRAFLLAFLGLALAQATYTVAPGDTLYSIARRYGTTVEELMRLNGLESFLLQPGQVLKLPRGKDPRGGPGGHPLFPGAPLRHHRGSPHALKRPLLPGDQGGAGPEASRRGRGASAPSPGAGGLGPGKPLLRAVLRYLGVPYKYGANSPLALDCSAFVAQVYAELGVALPRTTKEQYQAFPL